MSVIADSVSHRDSSLQHLKYRIAVERSGGRGDLDCARGRACGNGCRDVGIGFDGERCGSAVEGDSGRSGQIVAEDDDAGSGLGCDGHGFDQRAEAVREAENRPVIIGASVSCRTNERTIRCLRQRVARIFARTARITRSSAEVVECVKRPR